MLARRRLSGFRSRVLAALGSILAAVVLITGFEAPAHDHDAEVAGLHDAAPHGTCTHHDAERACSICRLAHESSIAPLAPVASAARESVTVARPPTQVAPVAGEPETERSPRAPPSLLSC